MAATRRSFAFALVLTIAAVRPCLGQDTAALAAPPQLALGDMESFLQNAKITATKSTKKGVTAAKRVTLSDGRVTHDAQIQDVDIALAIFEVHFAKFAARFVPFREHAVQRVVFVSHFALRLAVGKV